MQEIGFVPNLIKTIFNNDHLNIFLAKYFHTFLTSQWGSITEPNNNEKVEKISHLECLTIINY